MNVISLKIFLVRQKCIFALRNKIFCDGKLKITNKFEFEKFKIPNPDIWPFWEVFNFLNLILFCHFWFPIEKCLFSQSKHTFVLRKQFLG
jgi:hypothetical protein